MKLKQHRAVVGLILIWLGVADALLLRVPTLRGLNHRRSFCCRLFAQKEPSFVFSLSLDNGADVRVSLTSEEDLSREVARIVSENPDIKATRENLTTILRDQLMKMRAEPLLGPKLDAGQRLNDLIATLPIGNTGVVLDVAQSLLGSSAGHGLFLRKEGLDSPEIIMYRGQPLCGYAGRPSETPRAEGGRTIVIYFTSLDADVFFENDLQPLGRIIASYGNDLEVVGHRIQRDINGFPIAIEPDEKYTGQYRYFIPDCDEGQDLPLNLMRVGSFANDLAITSNQFGDICINHPSVDDSSPRNEREDSKGESEEYSRASANSNILALSFRMELDSEHKEGEPRRLIPLPPILTFTKNVRFTTTTPIEVGCHYGYQYWKELLSRK